MKAKIIKEIADLKEKKNFEFWDFEITDIEKMSDHCSLPESIVVDGLEIVKLNINEVCQHFHNKKETDFYLSGKLHPSEYIKYEQVIRDWNNDILLTPPTLVLMENQKNYLDKQWLHLHDGKHRFSVFNNFGFSECYFVIKQSEKEFFDKMII